MTSVSWPPRTVLTFVAIVLAALYLVASCGPDDRTRPDPGYNPDRNGGLWLDEGGQLSSAAFAARISAD